MGDRQIEMLWKCSSCGSRNLGRHLACPSCGNPKDGSEEWEMPEDTEAAPSVTDPALLALAQGGAAWRCGHCGSDQRRADGSCAACGASRAAAEPSAAAPLAAAGLPPLPPPVPPPVPGARPPPAPPPLPAARPRRRWRAGCAGVALGLVGLLALLAWCGWPRVVPARVEAVSWEQRITVERYRLVAHEGFAEARPAEAVEVRSLGPRRHHDEQVLDHYRTETYTQRVQDGYATERYTARVSCGETCTDHPRSCREKCTSNKNGFATCREVCTGGGRSCSTRYCSEPRTREVPRYRDELRTREVPVYRSEPRLAEAFAWRQWEWRPDRDLRASGASGEPFWPEVVRPALGPGEQEREVRAATYAVTLVIERWGTTHRFTYAPKSAEELRRFGVGSAHRLRVQADELLAVDPAE